MTLLQETIRVLDENGKKPQDVLWVGINDCHFTWADFVNLADVEYDDGFGAVEVREDLLIVGTNWWLERREYDGSEWWAFKTRPEKPSQYRVPHSLFND